MDIIWTIPIAFVFLLTGYAIGYWSNYQEMSRVIKLMTKEINEGRKKAIGLVSSEIELVEQLEREQDDD
jgi:hypothetical protein